MAATPAITTHAELSAGLRDALGSEQAAAELFDALYGVEGITKPDLRSVVEQMRDQTKLLFTRVRDKLGAAAIEIEGQRREGAQWITRVVVGEDMRLEIIVDDVHERDGGLRTRDLVQIRPV